MNPFFIALPLILLNFFTFVVKVIYYISYPREPAILIASLNFLLYAGLFLALSGLLPSETAESMAIFIAILLISTLLAMDVFLVYRIIRGKYG
jgi:hypothetical protein